MGLFARIHDARSNEQMRMILLRRAEGRRRQFEEGMKEAMEGGREMKVREFRKKT